MAEPTKFSNEYAADMLEDPWQLVGHGDTWGAIQSADIYNLGCKLECELKFSLGTIVIGYHNFRLVSKSTLTRPGRAAQSA